MDYLIQWNQYVQNYFMPFVPHIFMFVISTVFVVALIWVCLNIGKFSVRPSCEGCIMIVDVPNYRFRIGSPVYTFRASPGSPTRMIGQETLGLAEVQYGSQLRISLIGKWDRVDAFTIREILSPASEAIAHKYNIDLARKYKIGQSFPFRQSGEALRLADSTSYATVVQLYIPSDDTPSDGDKC